VAEEGQARTWLPGDNDPGDMREVWCSHGDLWFRTAKGWRCGLMGYTQQDKTWWWLTMYRGPLKEAS
jgi:hypothetical protein